MRRTDEPPQREPSLLRAWRDRGGYYIVYHLKAEGLDLLMRRGG